MPIGLRGPWTRHMVLRSQNLRSETSQPLLAKLWWVSVPVLIASQGLHASETRFGVAEYFWPIQGDSHTHSYLKEALDHHPINLLGDALTRRPREVEADEEADVDWFGSNAPSKNRFQIPSELADSCTVEQDCRFVPCSSPALCRTYLYQQETVAKVASVASMLCAAGNVDCVVSGGDSSHKPDPVILPPKASKRTHIPAFACERCHDAADIKPSYYLVASSENLTELNVEILRPTISILSTVPSFAGCVESQRTVTEYCYQQFAHHAIATETNESCPTCPKQQLTPPFLVAQNVTTLASVSGEFGDAAKLHWQIVQADVTHAADFKVVDPNRTDTVVRDIPYLLCAGCDAIQGLATGEDECVAGSCILLLTDSEHLTPKLHPFQSMPLIACADCQLTSLQGDHAWGRSLTIADIDSRAIEQVISGIDDSLILPLELDEPLQSLAHLEQPLEEHTTALAYSSSQDRTGVWSSAPSPIGYCVSTECEPDKPYLTHNHPTAARVAFKETPYDSLTDINHVSAFALNSPLGTDPFLYCEQDFAANNIVDGQGAEASLNQASKAFLVIAHDSSSGHHHSQGVARSAPNPKVWNKVERLSVPHVPKEVVESVASSATVPNQHNRQQVPNYWTVLDGLVNHDQPAQEVDVDLLASTQQDWAREEEASSLLDIEPTFVYGGGPEQQGPYVDLSPIFTAVDQEVLADDVQLADAVQVDLAPIVALAGQLAIDEELDGPEFVFTSKPSKKEFPSVTLESGETFAALMNTVRKDEIAPPITTDPRRLTTEENTSLVTHKLSAPTQNSQPKVVINPSVPETSVQTPDYSQLLVTAATEALPAPRDISLREDAQSLDLTPVEQQVASAAFAFATHLETTEPGSQQVVSASESSKVLIASASPTHSHQNVLSPKEAECLGLETPGCGSEGSFIAEAGEGTTRLGQSRLPQDGELQTPLTQMAIKALRVASETVGESEISKQALATQTGAQCSSPPVCAQRLYPQCEIAGQTQKPCYDVTQLKQLTACVEPKDCSDINAKVNRKPEDLWSVSPGPGSQHRTAEGKVPGGLNIASGRTGAPRAESDANSSQIRSLQGGYYYYIGDATNPNMSTNKDHLQVSGKVTHLPGTPSNVLADSMSVNRHGKERIGLSEASGRRVQRTTVALASNQKAQKAAQTPAPIKIDASIALTSKEVHGISDAHGRVERIGKERRKPVKVVDATQLPKAFTQAGKVTRAAKPVIADAAPDKKNRFLVEVTPHDDANPTMKSLIGPTSPSNKTTPPRNESFLIDFANAADSIGYEPAAFAAAGASFYDTFDADDEEDDEDTSEIAFVFGVGAGVHHDYEQDQEEEDNEDADDFAYEIYFRGEPGIDPLNRKPSVLGVKRDGAWSNEPYAVEDEEDDEVEWHPPDKSLDADYLASYEVAENDEGEPEGPLQKKNRQFSESATVGYTEYSHDDSAADDTDDDAPGVSATETSAADHNFTAQDNEVGDTALSEWEKLRTPPALAPLKKRDLDPRRGIDKTIAQETLFESGIPEQAQKPSTPGVKGESKVIIEEEEEPQGLLINYRDILMTEYIKFVSQLTNKNFVFNDEDLQFKITVISEQPTSVDNIMAALLQELRIHGLMVIEQGNNIIIHKSDKTRGPVKVVKGDEKESHAQLVTRVFQLDSIPADKMQEIVTPIMSAQALVQVLPDTNNMLVTDFTDNVNRIADLIRALDKPTTAFEIGQYVGRNNFIENLIPLAEEIIGPFAEKQNIVFVPHLATNSVFIVSNPLLVKRTIGIFEHLDALEGSTKILTLDDLSKGGQALLTPPDDDRVDWEEDDEEQQRSSKTEQERAEEIRARLEREAAGDRRSGGPLDLLPSGTPQKQDAIIPQLVQETHIEQPPMPETKFYIHKLQYRKGDQLQDALTRISDSLRLSEKASIDLINAINSIQWIESSNSLIVTGVPDALSRVKELIEEVDTPLRQVFLEMLILDTTITDSLTYAVDITSNFKGQTVGAAQGFSGGQPAASGAATPLVGAVNAASAINAAGSAVETLIDATALAAVSTPGYNLGIIGRRILKDGLFFNTMGALVQAVHTDINSEIVLNPKIIVEDNNEAEIFVGENIAYQTQSVVNNDGTIVSQNYEYRDVGTTLKVRPQIGNNNVITLEIEQEVSSTITTQTGSTTGGGGTAGSAQTSPGPSTATSRTVTKVHVPNEFFVVISGMIKDEKKKQRSQIPCLGGIPILGAAGSRVDNTGSKRNLMIFIRPQIIDTEWDFDNLNGTQQNIYNDKSRPKPRWKYEADEGLDFMNLPRVNERCETDGWIPGYRDDQAPVCDR